MPKRFKRESDDCGSSTESTDYNFLYPNEIYSYVDGLMNFLVSGRILSSSFSEIYVKSRTIGWKQFITEEGKQRREPAKKFVIKRLLLNRFVKELKTLSSTFDAKLEILKNQIDELMSEKCERNFSSEIDSIFHEIDSWRKLMSSRRLFVCERRFLCNLMTLQEILTTQFIGLLQKPDSTNDLFNLLNHAIIIVEQPSGAECVGVTKYEKIGRDFLAKIRTRIICLIKPEVLRVTGIASTIKVILFPYDREIDPMGDEQNPIFWQTRTILNTEQTRRTFLFAEITDSTPITLKKLNNRKRLLYNNQLCQICFFVEFTIPPHVNQHRCVVESRPFGLCCRANYYPKYLAKVYVQELIYQNPDFVRAETNVEQLESFFYRFFVRFTGVKIDERTKIFFKEKFNEALENFQQQTALEQNNNPFVSSTLYEDLLAKVFNQLRILNMFPFLAMMYEDNQFYGFADESIDNKLSENNENTKILIRFESFDDTLSTELPDLFFVAFQQQLRHAALKVNDLSDDLCQCVCESAKSNNRNITIFTDNGNIPFESFSWYFDQSLTQQETIQIQGGIQLYSFRNLLRETVGGTQRQISTSSFGSSNELNATHESSDLETEQNFTISGQVFGASSLINQVFDFLDQEFKMFLRQRNVRGSLRILPPAEPNFATLNVLEEFPDFWPLE